MNPETFKGIEPERMRANLRGSLNSLGLAMGDNEGWIKELNGWKAHIQSRSTRSGVGHYRSKEREQAIIKLMEAIQWLQSDIEQIRHCQEIERKYLSELPPAIKP